VWPDEKVERLKSLWANGESIGRIALELGGISRNSVIGKVTRLGLARRENTKTNHNAKPWCRSERIQVASKPRRTPRAAPALAAEGPSIEPVSDTAPRSEPPPAVAPCGLMDLRADSCRFPFGDVRDSGFHFCGGTAVTGLPYCGAHARIAYQPLRR
jgi:GcrA cell cycle regulator